MGNPVPCVTTMPYVRPGSLCRAISSANPIMRSHRLFLPAVPFALLCYGCGQSPPAKIAGPAPASRVARADWNPSATSVGGVRLVEWEQPTSNGIRRLPTVDSASLPILKRLPPIQMEPLPPVPLPSSAAASPPDEPRQERIGPQLDKYEPLRSSSISSQYEAIYDALPTVSRADLDRAYLPEAVQHQARTLLEQATQLADRGAIYAARGEFLKVLRLVTQSLDASLGRPVHVPALIMGMRALEEADDFALADRHLESDVQLAGFIASHKTPVLKQTEVRQISPLLAIQKYYEYAYQHLALAGNRERTAAEALFALGRIEMLVSTSQIDNGKGAPKSIAFFNAALTVDPRNARAANELGVLLARRGRLSEARDVLEHCRMAAPTTIALRNLSEVQKRLGQMEQSQQTLLLAQQTASASNTGTALESSPFGPVQWVDPRSFAQMDDANGIPEPIPLTTTAATPTMSMPPAGTDGVEHVADTSPSRPTWFGF